LLNRRVPPEWRRLLEQIVCGTPALRGALCVGYPEIFDQLVPGEDDDDRRARLAFAKHACRCCPALLACARWVDALPTRERPPGVTAGVLRLGSYRDRARQS
jgi:hypothetical protein